jgi:geranylgeranyl pyrophosphate synthase
VWVSQVAGGDAEQAIVPAAAWHLLHVAAMLLDDVEDNELTLKGWPPMTAGQAINVATTLIFLSQLMLTELDHAEVDHTRIRALQVTYDRAILRMCAGQHLDLNTTSTDLGAHWRMVAAKSGEFFSLPCRAGAILATDEPRIVEAYAEFNLNLGILVQIGDDIRGVWHPLGPVDLLHGSKTLPVAYALSVSDEKRRAHLQEILRRAVVDPHWATEARRMISEVGAIEYLLAEAQIRRERALRALPSMEDSETQACLIAVLNQVTPRLYLDS